MLLKAVLIGIVATALLDLWNLALNRILGMPLPNWAMVGRWFAHLPAGRLVHDRIGDSPAVPGERIIGWIAHYAIGILFALALFVLWPRWSASPTLLEPMIVGWVTILCGWLILSPGLGNGLAHARTPAPMRARLLNVAGHTVFGLGLFLGGLALAS